MEEKKTSTADILAKIRAQKAAAAAADAPTEDGGRRLEAAATTSAASPSVPAAPEAPASPEVIVPVVIAPTPAAITGLKPSSTKDIMAAIRSKGEKAAAPSSAPSPAVAFPVGAATAPTAGVTIIAATASAAAPPGPRLSVPEMLKHMREGKAAADATVPAQPMMAKLTTPVPAPPMPAKPIPAMKASKPVPARRGLAGITTVASISATCFVLGLITGSKLLLGVGALVWAALMTPFAAAWASVGGVGTIWTLGTARFMFPNVLVEPPSKFKVGPLSDYPINTVSNKWKDQFGIWVVHTDQYEGRNMIFALASVCTHLGCTPNWLDGEQKFKCPCHGSGFYMTGVNFEGPAPRPLERVGLRVAEDGMLEVNKSVKFQEEMGNWADPTSYVDVV